MSARSRRAIAAMRALLPGAGDYRMLRTTWRRDVLAGITVGVVALPLALGFGVSSGLTAEQGLVTAIVAGLLAAVFGGSNVQVSGPTGAMVVVLLPIVATHGAAAVATVTLVAGVIVVLAGVLRMGRAVSFIPWPVIEGFGVGIAVIIFLQQVPSVVSGHHAAAGELSSNAVVAAVQSVVAGDPIYALWGIGAAVVVAACMVLAPRVHPSLPGSLIGIALVTILAVVLPTPLATIGEIPASLPAPAFPPLSDLPALLPPALAVAALAAIESLLSARVASSLADTGPFDPDRELVGQGVASIGASLFGGMPATGAIARTSVNVRAGGRSRLSAIVHALVLLLFVLAMSGLVGMIPLAALAGVLFVTAVRMVSLMTVRSVLRSTRADAVGFVLTALVTISFDLIVAVAIGFALAAVFALRGLARSAGVEREPLPGPAAEGDERIAVVRIDGPLFFASADRVSDTVLGLDGVSVVILRMSQLELVDATGAHILSGIVTTLERRGITVLIKGVREGHAELFRNVGVLNALRHHRHLFATLDDAVAHARSHVQREGS